MTKTKKNIQEIKTSNKINAMANIHSILNSDKKVKHLDILNIYKLNLY